jgi:tRNA A37 threonylcarbamoyltransferase TsaD
LADGIIRCVKAGQPKKLIGIHHKGGVIMKRTTIGAHLAKQAFDLFVGDGTTQVVERKRMSRKKMLAWFADCP